MAEDGTSTVRGPKEAFYEPEMGHPYVTVNRYNESVLDAAGHPIQAIHPGDVVELMDNPHAPQHYDISVHGAPGGMGLAEPCFRVVLPDHREGYIRVKVSVFGLKYVFNDLLAGPREGQDINLHFFNPMTVPGWVMEDPNPDCAVYSQAIIPYGTPVKVLSEEPVQLMRVRGDRVDETREYYFPVVGQLESGEKVAGYARKEDLMSQRPALGGDPRVEGFFEEVIG